jgi:hypothetical protein
LGVLKQMPTAFAPKGSVNLFELGASVAAMQQIDTGHWIRHPSD